MATTLQVTNGTGNESVAVYLTLGTQTGNATIGDFKKFTSIGGSYLAGYITLGSYESYTFSEGIYMNGNLCFGCEPQCPGPGIPQFPSGTTAFEFNLNVPGGNNEGIDISCVNGVNSFITVDVSGGGTFITNGSPAPLPIYNKGAGHSDNYGLYGVYPAGCTSCTGGVHNAPCSNVPNQQPQKDPICLLSRDGNDGGGTIYVTFTGYYNGPASAK
ncbi:MAG TPA: hypothetical protein VGJ81_08060 [Thermoanaerobaculia bacterium]|jgi:hypothetical protein